MDDRFILKTIFEQTICPAGHALGIVILVHITKLGSCEYIAIYVIHVMPLL